MGNARIGFKKYKGFRKALSKNEAQTCTECMARGCTGGTHARRRALIERKIVNIMTAIKAGILMPSTKAELEKLEAERARLLQNVLEQQTKADTVATILPNTIGRSKAMLDDLINVTQHQVDKARGILRELMESEIVLHSTSDGLERYLTAEVSGDYAGLLRLVAGKNKFGGGHPSFRYLRPTFAPTLRIPLRPPKTAKAQSSIP